MKEEEDDEDNTIGIARYPCLPSLVALQQMRNRLHLAQTGKKLMKWTAMATGRELRRMAGELIVAYRDFDKKVKNAYIALARCRYFYPNLNHMVLNNAPQNPKEAQVTVESAIKNITGCRIISFEVQRGPVDNYEHLALEKGGQAVADAKEQWYQLLCLMVTQLQLRTSFELAELSHKGAAKKMNVLAKIVIPRTEASIQYILAELEEKEREEFFRMKKILQIKERKKEKIKGLNGESLFDCPVCHVCKVPIRKMNVLSKVVIPRTEASIAYILLELEERSREELFRVKLVSKNKVKKKKILSNQLLKRDGKLPEAGKENEQPCPCTQKLPSTKGSKVSIAEPATKISSKPLTDVKHSKTDDLEIQGPNANCRLIPENTKPISKETIDNSATTTKSELSQPKSLSIVEKTPASESQGVLAKLMAYLSSGYGLYGDDEHTSKSCSSDKYHVSNINGLIEDIIEMTKEYHAQGLISLAATKDLIKCCEEAKTPVKNTDVENFKAMSLKDKVKDLGFQLTNMQRTDVTNSKYDSFVAELEKFEAELAKEEIEQEEGQDTCQMCSHCGEVKEKLDKRKQKITEEEEKKKMEKEKEEKEKEEKEKKEKEKEREREREREEEKLSEETQKRELESQILAQLQQNIDDIVDMFEKMKMQNMATSSVERYLAMSDFRQSDAKTSSIYVGSCSCAEFTSNDMFNTSLEGDYGQCFQSDVYPCNPCNESNEDNIDDTQCKSESNYYTPIESNCSCEVCPKRKKKCDNTLDQCTSSETKKEVSMPDIFNVEPRPESVPIDNEVGYFEQNVRTIIRVKRIKENDGTVLEEREIITIKKDIHDPTETQMRHVEEDHEPYESLLKKYNKQEKLKGNNKNEKEKEKAKKKDKKLMKDDENESGKEEKDNEKDDKEKKKEKKLQIK